MSIYLIFLPLLSSSPVALGKPGFSKMARSGSSVQAKLVGMSSMGASHNKKDDRNIKIRIDRWSEIDRKPEMINTNFDSLARQ